MDEQGPILTTPGVQEERPTPTVSPAEPKNTPINQSGSQPGAGFLRFFLDIAETIILAAVLFVGINAVSARIRVDGFSMQPTLDDGEFVIVNKLAYRFSNPKRGDVIVFRYPRNLQQEYIKRIIDLPEDHIRIQNGVVYVNDTPLDEPYIAAAPHYQADWIVPEGSVFVLGDNRNNSSDSHNWGPAPLENVIGKALLIYWPPQSWGIIDQPVSAEAAP